MADVLGAGHMLLVNAICLLFQYIGDPVEDRDVGHTYAEHRARHDIDDHIDIRFWHAEGQRDSLDPLPVRVGFEVQFGVFGPDHAASSIVSKSKGRTQRGSLWTRSRPRSRPIVQRRASSPDAHFQETTT